MEEEKIIIDWLNLPVLGNEEIDPEDGGVIYEDRIECHPSKVEMLKEGLKGMKGINNENNSLT